MTANIKKKKKAAKSILVDICNLFVAANNGHSRYLAAAAKYRVFCICMFEKQHIFAPGFRKT